MRIDCTLNCAIGLFWWHASKPTVTFHCTFVLCICTFPERFPIKISILIDIWTWNALRIRFSCRMSVSYFKWHSWNLSRIFFGKVECFQMANETKFFYAQVPKILNRFTAHVEKLKFSTVFSWTEFELELKKMVKKFPSLNIDARSYGLTWSMQYLSTQNNQRSSALCRHNLSCIYFTVFGRIIITEILTFSLSFCKFQASSSSSLFLIEYGLRLRCLKFVKNKSY